MSSGRLRSGALPGMHIGRHEINPALGLAPMAGVTDKPFRLLCRRLGAGLATSEMTTANPDLWHTQKSLKRMDHARSEEHTSELQSRGHLVCRLLLEKKKRQKYRN